MPKETEQFGKGSRIPPSVKLESGFCELGPELSCKLSFDARTSDVRVLDLYMLFDERDPYNLSRDFSSL